MRRALVLLAIASLTVAGCSEQGHAPPVKSGTSMADSAEQVMLNVRSLLTDKGIQRGEMFADSAYIFDDNTRFELRKVRATFNTSTGVKDGTMSGDRGRYNLREQVLEGYGNVVITTNDGKRLTSPHVRYSQAMNQVSSDSAFTMVEAGRTLSGVGFRSDPQLNNVVVLKGARGRGSFTLPGQ
ncbi:MAG TPA: LPS export ABC transporter periplasmic protein LptC [Gemmatimonadaceae bacterium]|nr:LPS export ABC transporter periplasmic protein LptC [Gemmatimonadaceae bacterium]